MLLFHIVIRSTGAHAQVAATETHIENEGRARAEGVGWASCQDCTASGKTEGLEGFDSRSDRDQPPALSRLDRILHTRVEPCRLFTVCSEAFILFVDQQLPDLCTPEFHQDA
jgi:hypothetical protein